MRLRRAIGLVLLASARAAQAEGAREALVAGQAKEEAQVQAQMPMAARPGDRRLRHTESHVCGYPLGVTGGIERESVDPDPSHGPTSPSR